MGSWVQGAWVWSVGWRRTLLERENEQVLLLYSVINNVSLRAGIQDGWRWKATSDGNYSTKSAYNIFGQTCSRRNLMEEDKTLEAMWKAPAPFKTKTTAWRILIGRMATCENLAKRNITIQAEEAKCMTCKNHAESSNHFFFVCANTSLVWCDILGLIGFSSALPNSSKDRFYIFSNLGRKMDRNFLNGVWIAVVWCLWKWRNDCKFNNETWDRDKIVA